jgi:hypothetical protein
VAAVLPTVSHLPEEDAFEQLLALKLILDDINVGDETFLLDIIRSMITHFAHQPEVERFTVEMLIQRIRELCSTGGASFDPQQRQLPQRLTLGPIVIPNGVLTCAARENGAIELFPKCEFPLPTCCEIEQTKPSLSGSGRNWFGALNYAPHSLKMCFCRGTIDLSVFDADVVVKEWCQGVFANAKFTACDAQPFVYAAVACGSLLCDWHRLLRLICSPSRRLPSNKIDIVLCDSIYSCLKAEMASCQTLDVDARVENALFLESYWRTHAILAFGRWRGRLSAPTLPRSCLISHLHSTAHVTNTGCSYVFFCFQAMKRTLIVLNESWHCGHTPLTSMHGTYSHRADRLSALTSCTQHRTDHCLFTESPN